MKMRISENNSIRIKNALRIASDVLLFLLVAIALFILIISIVSKKDSDGTATVFGYQLRFVQSNSMEVCEETDVSNYEIKSIPIKSCVFIQTAPENDAEREAWYQTLKEGDVLTIKYVYIKQETITHRIIEISQTETGGYVFTLEGDNKSSDANLLRQTIDTSLADNPNYIVGKVTGQSYVLGLMVYAFKSPIGIVCLIIVPCLIIIGYEILRLYRVFGKEKKEKLLAQQEEQANEIEELKRRLAQLQNGTASNDDGTENTEKE